MTFATTQDLGFAHSFYPFSWHFDKIRYNNWVNQDEKCFVPRRLCILLESSKSNPIRFLSICMFVTLWLVNIDIQIMHKCHDFTVHLHTLDSGNHTWH